MLKLVLRRETATMRFFALVRVPNGRPGTPALAPPVVRQGEERRRSAENVPGPSVTYHHKRDGTKG